MNNNQTTLKMHDTETTTINGKEYFTRYWYMNNDVHNVRNDGEATRRHLVFYAQFGEVVKGYVKQCFSKKEWEKIEAAEDHRHFNNIFDLSRWDIINVRGIVGALYSDCCYVNRPKGRIYWSLSDNICIVKAAVRLILAEQGKLKVNQNGN